MRIPLIACICTSVFTPLKTISALEVVRDGEAAATIVVSNPVENRWDRKTGPSEGYTAQVLADWLEKISGAQLPITAEPPKSGTAIYIGKAAVDAGLELGDIESRSKEGMRIRCAKGRVLVAGQSDTATLKAACRLLEELGCRYLMDHPLGEIYPERKTVTLATDLSITDKPGFAMRRIWGSVWSKNNLWKVWNGAGGLNLPTGHAWGRYIDKSEFGKHPEWFALRGGERREGDWYCTSNKDLRKAFADGVIAQIAKSGNENVSISPPDGRGYCECEKCRSQDDPTNIEPSSGTVSVSNRYATFYKSVAEKVARKFPGALLSFYCYADYTQAPTPAIDLPDNLIAWIAPIRYCRYHHIAAENCPSRHQLADLIDGWSQSANQLGYRTYNFNLAAALAPFSKVQVWAHDIPYLHQRGATGINFETFRNWRIYGPHIYQSIRLAYDPDADVAAMMDDYYSHLYGVKAGSLIAEYWGEIEKGFAETDVHSGSYYALHNVYTPERLKRLRSLIGDAEKAAKSHANNLERVRMTAGGFRNVEQYIELRAAINRGDTGSMQETYDSLLKRTEEASEGGLGYHYTPKYLKRFLGVNIAAASEATRDAKSVTVLEDEWKLEYAAEADGAKRGFHETDFDDSDWKTVRTYSDTLNAQGVEDRTTIMWYRQKLEWPKGAKNQRLFFFENDGLSTVYINGREVGEGGKPRSAFSADASSLKAGTNTIAVRIDHSKITDLDLGGILRPVYLIEQ